MGSNPHLFFVHFAKKIFFKRVLTNAARCGIIEGGGMAGRPRQQGPVFRIPDPICKISPTSSDFLSRANFPENRVTGLAPYAAEKS